jgi:mevalonate kinase
MNPGPFYSCGKVMLTGEYAVLHGAKALSLPATVGQTLNVELHHLPEVVVQSHTLHGATWLQARYSLEGTLLDGPPAAVRLQALLQKALALSGATTLPPSQLTFQLQFEQHWGLGSSATLVHLVAQWLGVDAMALFERTEKGSGYDLATALEGQPIVYQITPEGPRWKPTAAHWPFMDQLWLVPTGGKQRSDVEVTRFLERPVPQTAQLDRISAIAEELVEVSNPTDFKALMHEHEQIIAAMVGQTPLAERFPHPNLGLKWLGAWGGDLVLAVGAFAAVSQWAANCGFEPPQALDSLTLTH